MISEETKKLYQKALRLKGLENQLDITIEEISELLQAIIKWRRAKIESYEKIVLVEHLSEEIGDTEIMLEQLKLSFNIEKEVDEFKNKKLKRLEKRLKILEEGKEEK